MTTEKIKIALDWTPNINHIGFFVAQEKGFYSANGIEVEIIDPSIDNYAVTPAKKVELGEADFALCPTESVISFRTKAEPFPLKAVAAIFQQDLSAIAVNKEANVHSPKGLDGKTYASYKARYEDQIVKQMIRNDGGEGSIEVVYPEKLGIWETLVKSQYDATWIFLNWEGVEAEQNGVALNYFKMQDYGIPYSYSPVIVVDERNIEAKSAAYRSFLKAVKEGFQYCRTNPVEATQILKKYVPEQDQKIDLEKALQQSVGALGDEQQWGKMDEENIRTFLDWLYKNNLETQQLEAKTLFTNQLLS